MPEIMQKLTDMELPDTTSIYFSESFVPCLFSFLSSHPKTFLGSNWLCLILASKFCICCFIFKNNNPYPSFLFKILTHISRFISSPTFSIKSLLTTHNGLWESFSFHEFCNNFFVQWPCYHFIIMIPLHFISCTKLEIH